MTEIDSELLERFDSAVAHVRSHSYNTSHNLRLYGLYKQITVGDCNIARPAVYKVTALAKFQAWKACVGLDAKQAMENYVAYLAKIDKSFKPEKIVIRTQAESKAVEELEDLPPIPPPIFHGRQNKSKRELTEFKVVAHQSGVDPITNQEDSENRLLLHERLVNFYSHFDPQRLTRGIGELVEYAVNLGEDKLNQKLKAKYGFDLTSFESKQMETESTLQQRLQSVRQNHLTRKLQANQNLNNKALKSTKEAKSPPAKQSFGSKSPETELREKLEVFFLSYDPERLSVGIETGFDEIVKYVENRGLEALNSKLIKKYGKSLNDADFLLNQLASSAKQSFHSQNTSESFSSGNKSKQEKSKSKDVMKRMSKMSKHNSQSERNITDFENLEVSQEIEELKTEDVTNILLPKYVEVSLMGYYAKYEPSRLRNAQVKPIFEWAERNGIKALNLQLKKRYGESLDEFVFQCDRLRDELIQFYTQTDKGKLVNGIEKILNWAIKNGRQALNTKLRDKYGFDLNTYKSDFSNIDTATEVEF